MTDRAGRPGFRRHRRRLGPESPLVGGPVVTEPSMGGPVEARAGAEEAALASTFDPRADDYARPEVSSGVVPERANLPDLRALPPGCRFQDRCPEVFDRCRQRRPDLLPAAGTDAACWLYDRALVPAERVAGG